MDALPGAFGVGCGKSLAHVLLEGAIVGSAFRVSLSRRFICACRARFYSIDALKRTYDTRAVVKLIKYTGRCRLLSSFTFKMSHENMIQHGSSTFSSDWQDPSTVQQVWNKSKGGSQNTWSNLKHTCTHETTKQALVTRRPQRAGAAAKRKTARRSMLRSS